MIRLSWIMKACGVFLLWAGAAISLPAQTFTTLFSFDQTDGAAPYAGLVQGIDGNLYGTTTYRGADNGGTAFKITPTGTLTTAYNFCSLSGCADGEGPLAQLLVASNGSLYGTTSQGGANGYGTIFKVTHGTLTTLYNFCPQNSCTEFPYGPWAPLIQATNGDFYGTTPGSGPNVGTGGTVFKITANGTFTTLYNFCSQTNCTDGFFPRAGLVQATNGDFYGTTQAGGANISYGTVFKITPSGKLTTLYSFCSQSGCPDGSSPVGGLVQGTNGDFYGTTDAGGANCAPFGCGTVFEITPRGILTMLHSFDGTDGSGPQSTMFQASDGNYYGTTELGGANGYGTVFKITPSGTFTSLYSFCSLPYCADGQYGWPGVIQDTNGTFYGTTASGGTNGTNAGIVYSLAVGLGPFVETNPTSGKVGATVTILGTSLTGATSVTFNGTAATFTVKSSSEITTTVPTGATTGTVQVVTPTSGTLSSNVPFTVRP